MTRQGSGGGAAARIVTHRPHNSRKAGHWSSADCRLIGLREQANMNIQRLFFRYSSLRHRGLHNGRDRFGRQRIAQGLSRLHYPII